MRQHVNKDSSFWDSILWSDESRFELFGFGSKRRKRVCRKINAGLLDQNLKKQTVKLVVDRMGWGCFAANGFGELAVVEGIITCASYRKIVSNIVQKSAQKFHLSRRFIFQHDNDP